jgi:hypothetical protein
VEVKKINQVEMLEMETPTNQITKAQWIILSVVKIREKKNIRNG